MDIWLKVGEAKSLSKSHLCRFQKRLWKRLSQRVNSQKVIRIRMKNLDKLAAKFFQQKNPW